MARGGLRTATHPKHKTGLLGAQIGTARKAMLVNYSLNTGQTFIEHISTLIDKDVRDNPHLYSVPVDLNKALKECYNINDKIILILRKQKQMMSKRFITSMLCKYDRKIDRGILGILVTKALSSEMFYCTKKNQKHARFGLTEWLDNITKL